MIVYSIKTIVRILSDQDDAMESILNKDSKLDAGEWEKIRLHPDFGEEILKPIPTLQAECRIVRHHHERMDGQGYPDGLYGNQLNLSEKIIIVADAFDAMNSKRAYREPLEAREIIAELENNKGSQFDPEVVTVFLAIYDEELRVPMAPADGRKIIPIKAPAPAGLL